MYPRGLPSFGPRERCSYSPARVPVQDGAACGVGERVLPVCGGGAGGEGLVGSPSRPAPRIASGLTSEPPSNERPPQLNVNDGYPRNRGSEKPERVGERARTKTCRATREMRLDSRLFSFARGLTRDRRGCHSLPLQPPCPTDSAAYSRRSVGSVSRLTERVRRVRNPSALARSSGAPAGLGP